MVSSSLLLLPDCAEVDISPGGAWDLGVEGWEDLSDLPGASDVVT